MYKEPYSYTNKCTLNEPNYIFTIKASLANLTDLNKIDQKDLTKRWLLEFWVQLRPAFIQNLSSTFLFLKLLYMKFYFNSKFEDDIASFMDCIRCLILSPTLFWRCLKNSFSSFSRFSLGKKKEKYILLLQTLVKQGNKFSCRTETRIFLLEGKIDAENNVPYCKTGKH